MGALASKAQQADVARRLATARRGQRDRLRDATASRRRARASRAVPSSRRRSCCAATAVKNDAVHDVEAFGPVSTLMPYDDFDEAIALAARGRGSLVATLVTPRSEGRGEGDPAAGGVAWAPPRPRSRSPPPSRPATARPCRCSSTAARARRRRRGARRHPRRQALPAARRGPGLADDADRGDRRVRRGAALQEGDIHPFRKHFEDLAIGDSLLTHRAP